jgi:hypothetical protein
VTGTKDPFSGFTLTPPVPITSFAPPETPSLAVEQQAVTPEEKDQITVTGRREPSFTVATPIPFNPVPDIGALKQPIPEIQAPPAEQAAADKDEIVVTANPYEPPKITDNILTSVAPAIVGNLGPDIPDTPAPPADKKLSVSDYIKLAGLAATGIGMLGGGGGEGTAAGIVPGGLGRLNPIFSAKLPTGADVNIPGGVGTASNFAARPMGDEDWLTYGQRPEKSFFNYVPQPPTGMAHGGSLAAKRGGRPSRSSFAVNGPGTGRSDDIPAVLSDGEYVIDAETVALLGDGSSKAGAKKLDDLRVKIRKHKGQRLSQGRFSSDAKKPEAYLTGGRI